MHVNKNYGLIIILKLFHFSMAITIKQTQTFPVKNALSLNQI